MKPDNKGRLKVFTKPVPKEAYAIGCDVAEGIESGDYSTAFVLNTKGEQVAAWHGHIAPDVFGEMLCRLGAYYNNALLAVEVNNHGLTATTKIRDRGYTNVYMRQVKDERGEDYTSKIGWHTNVKTKPLMLDEFVGAVRDDRIKILDYDLLIEMTELYLDENGNVDIGGKDRVAAAAIAWQALKQLPKELYKVTYPDSDGKKEKYKNLLERNKLKEKKESYYE